MLIWMGCYVTGLDWLLVGVALCINEFFLCCFIASAFGELACVYVDFDYVLML